MDRFRVWTDFMNGNLLRIMSSSELEKHVKERQLYRYCTLESCTHVEM